MRSSETRREKGLFTMKKWEMKNTKRIKRMQIIVATPLKACACPKVKINKNNKRLSYFSRSQQSSVTLNPVIV